PEYSLSRNHINAEYLWHISDSTTFISDLNYDVDDDELGVYNAGLAVVRNPRLRYYVGTRYLPKIDSSVGTFGLDYQLTRKYSLSLFQQYDFDFQGSRNLVSQVALIRKFPRWYVGITLNYVRDVREDDEVGVMFTIWPEGVPEVRLGSDRFGLLGRSDEN
ncbi:MAG: hypothetical protein ACOC93_03325, partial [Planctomycetota bacterium]